MRHLGQISWGKIKVGEVFAYKACWAILIKTGDKTAFTLSHNRDCSIIEKRVKIFGWREIKFEYMNSGYFCRRSPRMLLPRAAEPFYKLPRYWQEMYRP